MSSEASIEELKGIVQKTLEAKGVLGKIRAELRSSVFSAIQEEQADLSGESPVLRELKRSAEGRAALELVREFLVVCGLDYTTAVYVPEANLAKEGERRDELAGKLRFPALSTGAGALKMPLLVELLRAQGRRDVPGAPSPSGAPAPTAPAPTAPTAASLAPLRAESSAPKSRVPALGAPETSAAALEPAALVARLPLAEPPLQALGVPGSRRHDDDAPAGSKNAAPSPSAGAGPGGTLLGRLPERASPLSARENADSEARRESSSPLAQADALSRVQSVSSLGSESPVSSPGGVPPALRRDKGAVAGGLGSGGLGGGFGGEGELGSGSVPGLRPLGAASTASALSSTLGAGSAGSLGPMGVGGAGALGRGLGGSGLGASPSYCSAGLGGASVPRSAPAGGPSGAAAAATAGAAASAAACAEPSPTCTSSSAGATGGASLLGNLPPLGAKRGGSGMSSLSGLPPLGGSHSLGAASSVEPPPAAPPASTISARGGGSIDFPAESSRDDDLKRLRAVEQRLKQMKDSSPPPVSAADKGDTARDAAARPHAAPAAAPPRAASAPGAPKLSALSDEQSVDDEIAEEVYSLEADSYHSEGESDQLEADSDKSAGAGGAWKNGASPHSCAVADQSMETSRLDFEDGYDHVEAVVF
ncbi:hypothetical protein KFE25_007118 [Diacronema lutheri]|uniref:FGFR1 oncogene partner (FOP) N-terminal dimerisation domain-containing protein n=1 Tax=Diacronema lutheri TaxID=2081491 RepID=A0A8J6CEF2_DIALT|nr:hypothetical protein KFE25_007118 [Diacronema lutheri]